MRRSERKRTEKHRVEVAAGIVKATKYVASHVVGIRPVLIKSFGKLGYWTKKTIKLSIPFAVLLFFTFVDLGIGMKAQYALGIFIFVALMWTFESLPLPVTALMVPVLLVVYDIFGEVPEVLAGVTDPASMAFAPFATPVVYLVLGGIIISTAFRKTHLDKRFALFIVAKSKGHFDKLLLAMMLACGTLSMWISNTATVALLIPVAIGIAGRAAKTKEKGDQYALTLLLGIGASAAIGGMATIVGTSANAISSQFIAEAVGAGNWTFLSWMKMGLPLSMVLLVVSWWILTKMYPVTKEKIDISWVQGELENMGKMDSREKTVLAILGGTIVFWIVGEGIASLILPPPFTPGAFANAAIVSVIAAILLFATRTLDWEDARLIPWGIFLIIGAGLALGEGLSAAGFNDWLSGLIMAMGGSLVATVIGAFLFLLLMAFIVVLMSNFVNNTATVAFFVPLMISLASNVSLGDEVLIKVFSLPVALAAAIAFMTPVAHPPSTLIYGSGMVSKKEMFKSGLVITIPSVLIAVLWLYVSINLGWI